MIPFGLGTPIISLVSHEKLSRFLDEIDNSEWGVDVLGGSFADELSTLLRATASSLLKQQRSIAESRYRMRSITQENVRMIHESLYS